MRTVVILTKLCLSLENNPRQCPRENLQDWTSKLRLVLNFGLGNRLELYLTNSTYNTL